MEEYLGMDGNYISREMIPYNSYEKLKNHDQIENQDGDRLRYIKRDKSLY